MRRFRLSALLVVSLLVFGITSCADNSSAPEVPSAPPMEPSVSGDQSNDILGLPPLDRLPIVGRLLSCRPLPYAQAEKIIGSAGGTLEVGPHRLWVPPGALRSSVRIRAEMPSDSVASLRLYPEGLQFRRSVFLTLDYNNCSLIRGLLPKRIAYTTEELRILQLLFSFDNILAREVTAPLDHFSRYAVSW